jgi:DNA-directed RNA polymerase subunit RPC12/RpoP
MKKCFKCNRSLPLWMYTINPRTYQNSSNKGKNYVCKICNYKLWSKDLYTWVWDNSINKFIRVEFKSKIDILKYLLSK